ncbi:hypothetical protein AAG570_007172 [Ranatra chinensis]|uniref:Uncharacterized protein n=1 Tax=Ranatra chinensis TaxID=642074 RepID=A0ABD0XV37_9HEMI
MTNAFQWIQYSIISNVVVKFYGDLPSTWVDWTSMVYMVFYIVLIVPGSWAVDYFGLRKCLVLGTLVNCAGAWVKVGSSRSDLFVVSFVGQCLSAASQVFVLSIPARLAAVWFGPDQVSSACAIGVFGNQVLRGYRGGGPFGRIF